MEDFQILQKLLRYKSITPDDDGCLDWIKSFLEEHNFKCEIISFSDDNFPTIKNLYARIGENGKNLCFAGHTDVVPVGNINSWGVDPFSGEIIGGYIYGRGAVDMKGAVASFIKAAISYIQEKKDNISISILLTGDEERDAINGTKKVLDYLDSKGEIIDLCIIGEPTSDKKIADKIKVGRRGSMCCKISIQGLQGHSAYPLNFDNPITKASNILYDLNKHEFDMGSQFFTPTNFQCVGIESKFISLNVIPEHVSMLCNIRMSNMQTKESLISTITEICDKHAKNHYTIDTNISFVSNAFLNDFDEDFMNFVISSIQEVTNLTPQKTTDGGITDARFMVSKFPVIEIGLKEYYAHKIDERVSISDIQTLTKIYKKIIEKLSIEVL